LKGNNIGIARKVSEECTENMKNMSILEGNEDGGHPIGMPAAWGHAGHNT
jgi:hypothetical protein